MALECKKLPYLGVLLETLSSIMIGCNGHNLLVVGVFSVLVGAFSVFNFVAGAVSVLNLYFGECSSCSFSLLLSDQELV